MGHTLSSEHGHALVQSSNLSRSGRLGYVISTPTLRQLRVPAGHLQATGQCCRETWRTLPGLTRLQRTKPRTLLGVKSGLKFASLTSGLYARSVRCRVGRAGKRLSAWSGNAEVAGGWVLKFLKIVVMPMCVHKWLFCLLSHGMTSSRLNLFGPHSDIQDFPKDFTYKISAGTRVHVQENRKGQILWLKAK